MKRRITDRRIVEVLAAFDVACTRARPWRRDFALQCEYEDAGLGSCWSDEFKVWYDERITQGGVA